ncbi:MAG: hypothetical protein ACK4WH_07460 [Phycisphaerales bacterium]
MGKKREKKKSGKEPRRKRAHPLAAHIVKLVKALGKHEGPRQTACEPMGYVIRFDGASDPSANCSIMKVYCCTCESPDDQCNCTMKNGDKGKRVEMLVAELEVPGVHKLLEKSGTKGAGGAGRAPGRRSS